MIKAVFWTYSGNYLGFDITGHSMHSESGSDIVCAAVSAMTMLVVNTVCEVYVQKAAVNVNEDNVSVSFLLKNSHQPSMGLIKGFFEELKSLQRDYPENINVTVKNSTERE